MQQDQKHPSASRDAREAREVEGQDGRPSAYPTPNGPSRAPGPLRRLVSWAARRPPMVQGVVTGTIWILASIGSTWACYAMAHRAYVHALEEELLSLARVAAMRVDPEAHARLTRADQQNGPEYLAIVGPLRQIALAATHLRYIYTIRPTPEGLRYVVDTGMPEDADGDGLIDQAGLGMICTQPDPALLQAVREGMSIASSEPYTDAWGTFYSAYVPVRHADGRLECLLAVDVEGKDYEAILGGIRRALVGTCTLALLASVFAGGCAAVGSRSRRDAMERLAVSERRLALAVDGQGEGVWDWDIASGSMYLSDRLGRMLGMRHGDAPQGDAMSAFFARVHRDDRNRVRAAMRAHFAREVPYDVEYRFRVGTGVYRWFRSRGQAVRDSQGRPVRFVGSVGDVTGPVRLRRQLRRDALLDRLTGLPNRATLLRRLRRAVRSRRGAAGPHFALLFLDFDRFKAVNDSLGHEGGDALLRAIADRLRANLRRGDGVRAPASSDLAARVAGDEFVVLLEGLRRPEEAAAVAGRLLDALAEPYEIQGCCVRSTASIGIVFDDPSYEDAEDLLRDADLAMYEAKAARPGGYLVFDDAMRRRGLRRIRLEQGLRDAIEGDRIELAYQPIVDLRSGQVVRVEALARWEHPELGPIGPDEFVPLAEECGLVVPLGEHVIDGAFGQLARWQAGPSQGLAPGISINLSRRHLLLPELAVRLRLAAERAGISPAEVLLEITEESMMRDVEGARRTLVALRDAGFRLAIDDFGTGYSSLACLHQFPFDLLKLDRSFVEDLGRSPQRTAVVRALVCLSGKLGIEVVAEGVETPQQLALLRELGCQFGQGYLFARPLPADEVARHFAGHPDTEHLRDAPCCPLPTSAVGC